MHCNRGKTTSCWSLDPATHYFGDHGQFAHFFLETIIQDPLCVRLYARYFHVLYSILLNHLPFLSFRFLTLLQTLAA